MRSRIRTRRWTVAWQTLLIALTFTLALVVAAGLAATLGLPTPASTNRSIALSLAGGLCVGLTLSLIVWQATWSRGQRFAIAACAVFLTIFSTAIEGIFFAPALNASLPAVAFMDVVAALTVGGVVMLGSVPVSDRTPPPLTSTSRPWYSWVWRFIASAASYVIFYWLYGALNYMLVTRPYYSAQHTVLQVPPAQSVLIAEVIRAPLLVASVLPLVLTMKLTRRQLTISCSAVLFVIGGVVPLLHQAGVLPTFLLIASGWEIFFQNVSLALVIAWLLGHAPGKETVGIFGREQVRSKAR